MNASYTGPWRRELADLLGLSPDQVTDCAKRGCPAPTAEDWSDRRATVVAAWVSWIRIHRPGWARRYLKPSAGIESPQDCGNEPLAGQERAELPADADADVVERALAKAKLRRAEAEADSAELDRDRTRGDLIRRTEAAAAVSAILPLASAELRELGAAIVQAAPPEVRAALRTATAALVSQAIDHYRAQARTIWRDSVPQTPKGPTT